MGQTEVASNAPVRIASPYNSTKIEKRVQSILESGRLVQGKTVEEFERSLAGYIGCNHVVCVNSGTAALHSSFLALKIPKLENKNEVITTPLSFTATANAVIHAGCKPVFVDVDERTFNIDPALVEEKVTERTLAIEPVDVYGLPAELDRIKRITDPLGLPVVEDAAEAIGSSHHGKKIGNISTVSCFSTYATKNLHTGEGGFVTTNDEAIANRVRIIRNQGQSSRYNQILLGYNFRMQEVSAAIGIEQIQLLDDFNLKRRQHAVYLKERLSKFDAIGFQEVSDTSESAWYLFSLLLDERKAGVSRGTLVAKLKEMGIEADIAWPTPIHLQPYFQERFGFKKGDFPKAEKICSQVFQLPIQPFLNQEQLDRIVEAVAKLLT